MAFLQVEAARRNPVVLLIASSLLIPLIVFALAAWQSYRDIVKENAGRAERTAGMLQEHAIKVLETHRLVIDRVKERVELVVWRRAGEDAALHNLLRHWQQALDQIATITLTDEVGHMRASSRVFPADASITFADRDWFTALSYSTSDQPYISKSYTGRQSGQSVFNVADRLVDERGAFRGVIAVSVDRSYFEKFYQAIEDDPSNSFLLMRTDGTILARTPAIDLPSVDDNNPLLTALQTSDVGIINAKPSSEGAEGIVAFRKIADYPLVVAFGVGRGAILSAWQRSLQIYGAIAFVSALSLLLVSGVVVRHIRREQLATTQWQAAARDLQAETLQREQLADQLRQSQKMDAVGRLTGGIAHDFNNLLTVVIGNLDLALRRLTDTDSRPARLVQNALEGANRAASLTHRLLAFSRQQPLAPKLTDTNKLVADMSEMLRRVLGESVAIETVQAGGLWKAFVDTNQLENALLNLAVNARDAMPNGGKLTIETANAHLDDAYAAARGEVTAGHYVMLGVSDTGIGMPPDVVRQAFEPFFTTKPVGQGTGLGLSQVYGFAKQSGGHVAIYSEEGQGTTVKIYLRRASLSVSHADVVEQETPPTEIIATSHGESILVVEDEDAVRNLSVTTLSEAGYCVFEAADGPSALKLLSAHPAIDLLFTDVVLTGPMNGRELADQALKQQPALKVLFTTGYTRNAIIHHGRLDEGVNFIGKPFNAAVLTTKVAALLA